MNEQISLEQLNKLKNAMAKLQENNRGSLVERFSETMDVTEAPAVAETMPMIKTEAKAEDDDKVLGRGTYLRVDKDEMAAWLYLTPPDKTPDYKKQDLLDYLSRKGVIIGLHQSNLSAMVKKKVYNREILVARGVFAKESSDGYFEYLFSQGEYAMPKIREDGTVDYSHMSALQNVKAGDKVAIYHRAVQGVDGKTVLGNVMKAKISRELPPLKGVGITRENDIYYAKTDGKIVVKNGRIDIQSVHEIFDDVTMIVGKMDFFGDIIIHGNVEDGVVLRAGRNIEIQGTVAGATLYAGGDVVLSRGISGGYKAKIFAGGNVFADFIEHTTINAEGMVQANTILNSIVCSSDKVIAAGKRGSIIGGYTHALKGVEATNSSNDVEIKTILHCGYEAVAYERLVEVKKQEEEDRKKIDELVQAMADTLREKRLHGLRVTEETELKLSEWDKLKDELFVELDKLVQEKAELEEMMEQSKGAEIKIDGTVYRGTIICVDSDQIVINQTTKFMKYTMNRGAIEGSVIV